MCSLDGISMLRMISPSYWIMQTRSRVRISIHYDCNNLVKPNCCMPPNKACTRSPAKSAGAMVVGLQPVGTACAFSNSLRGLKLVPSKWQYLVPPTSTLKGHNANRWAAYSLHQEIRGVCYEGIIHCC